MTTGRINQRTVVTAPAAAAARRSFERFRRRRERDRARPTFLSSGAIAARFSLAVLSRAVERAARSSSTLRVVGVVFYEGNRPARERRENALPLTRATLRALESAQRFFSFPRRRRRAFVTLRLRSSSQRRSTAWSRDGAGPSREADARANRRRYSDGRAGYGAPSLLRRARPSLRTALLAEKPARDTDDDRERKTNAVASARAERFSPPSHQRRSESTLNAARVRTAKFAIAYARPNLRNRTKPAGRTGTRPPRLKGKLDRA